MNVGDRVRVERDETRYPSKGTWPRFRGKTGTVVEVNHDRNRPHLTEYGVVFGKVTPRTDGRGAFSWSGNEPITWFKVYEIVSRAASQRHAERAEASELGIGTLKRRTSQKTAIAVGVREGVRRGEEEAAC